MTIIQNIRSMSSGNSLKVHKTQFEKFQVRLNKESITNWSKTHLIGNKSQLVEIRSEEDLCQLLKLSNLKVKPVGSKLSYQAISQQVQDGLLVDVKMKGMVSESENHIEVYSGTTLHELFQMILARGKMLTACPGVIAIQTVGGAISTGTHGQGLYQSTIADSIFQIILVDAKGNLKTVKKEDKNFGAYMTSLGCLGVITRVKFQLVDNKIFRCKKFNSSFEYLFNEFYNLSLDKIQTKAWWFPWTDQVQVWYMEEATCEEETAYNSHNKELMNVSQTDWSLQNTVELVKQKMARDTQDTNDAQNNLQVLTRFKAVTDVIGNIYQIMLKGIPIPQINCEIAVDFKHFQPLMIRLQQWFRENKHSLHYPFIIRTTGKSKAWLSSTHNQMSVHIGFLMYVSEDGNYVKGSLNLLREIQEIIASFDGRPHLGKRFSIELYDFDEKYENWGKFRTLMLEEDPQGRFRNPFVDKLFGLTKETDHLVSQKVLC